MAALYEIEIYRSDYQAPVDMQAIYSALEEAHIPFDREERRGGRAPSADDQVEYVYVESGYVGRGVQVINVLGYETDEDEDEDE